MALTARHLADEKNRFLKKFGLDEPHANNWLLIAYRDALTSATRRARLYRRDLTQRDRDIVRAGWALKLGELAYRYVGPAPRATTRAEFDSDLLVLKSFMNEHYGAFFRSGDEDGYRPGFRLAHAQKSLSLLLKHFWCNGIMGEPPCCPVDRRILRMASVSAADAAWTKVDDLDAYRAKLGALDAAAGASSLAPISLAEWELKAFN